ncbi:hypothetical protein ASPCAL13973 [Aspergillus calidoustus]|uniref:Uncharacterized protein n=1 Tax=Aspergillus calidoustus TaxID=454130 RepID=A0A0U5GEM2_ASPCI|nr:hypothetical protein ASPCAL13973 [Aspergillus calidoustus]
MASSGTLATAPQPLTTPFVPSESCVDKFRTTNYITSFSWDDFSTTTLRVLVSEEADSCLPSGWNGSPASEFQASPAVCPSAWTAYNLGATVFVERSPVTRSVTASTAFCCSSGFTLSYLSGIPIADTAANACFQPITTDTTSTSPASTTSTATDSDERTTTIRTTSTENPFPDGLRVHEAWHITWKASDVSILSPSPPDLGSCTSVALATWVPGEPVDSDSLSCRSTNSGVSHGSDSDTALFRFLVIGIPVIGVVVVGVGAVVCWRRRKKRKREHDMRGGGIAGRVLERPR